MSSFSIHTNVGQMVALSTLRKTNDESNVNQKRIQTGLKIADAFDDAAGFSLAQNLRSDVKSYGAVQESLSFAEGLADVTNAGLTNISDTIGDMDTLLTKLSDETLSSTQRTTYTNDLTKMRGQVDKFIAQSTYNGQNMIKAGGAAKNFLTDTTGTTMSLSYTDIDALKATFDGALNVSSAANAVTSKAALKTFADGVNTAMASVSADTRGLKAQNKFINSIVDATKKGLGSLVDADVAQESANMNSLQTRQQLATQALSIANSAPSSLLSLFR